MVEPELAILPGIIDGIFTVVVDAQHDFMRPDGKLYVPRAEALIAALQSHLDHMTGAGVLFTYDTHLPDVYAASEEAKQFPIHCVKGSPGWRLVVNPGRIEVPIYVMEKGVFDMWAEPDRRVYWTSFGSDAVPDYTQPWFERDEFFRRLYATGVRTIRLVGVAADYCVKWAAAGLVQRGFKVEILADLTVGIQRDIHTVVREDFEGQAVQCSEVTA